ncbi:MAG: hypothetical protein IPL88_12385 [Rhizobiales bacterium]|nr:hypothetical protein [Hyphomicrobiales bacterium]
MRWTSVSENSFSRSERSLSGVGSEPDSIPSENIPAILLTRNATDMAATLDPVAADDKDAGLPAIEAERSNAG